MWGHHYLGKRSIFKDSQRIVLEANSKTSAAILVDFLTSSFSTRCRSVICHLGIEMVVGKVIDVICSRIENLSREDFFVGLLADSSGHADPSKAVERVNYAISDSLMEYVDVLILPWPKLTEADESVPANATKRLIERMESEYFLRTWEAFQPLIKEGKVKHMGISTKKRSHLEYVLGKASLPPKLLYITVTPTNQEQSLVRFCHQRGLDVIGHLKIEESDADALKEIEELTKDTGKSVTENLVIWLIQRGLQPLPDLDSILPPWDPNSGEEFDAWRQTLVDRSNRLFLLLHPLGLRPEHYAPNSGYVHDLSKEQMASIADLDMQSKLQLATPAPTFKRRLGHSRSTTSSFPTTPQSRQTRSTAKTGSSKVLEDYSLDLEQPTDERMPSARSEKGHGGYAVMLSGIDDLYRRPYSQSRPRVESVSGFMPQLSLDIESQPTAEQRSLPSTQMEDSGTKSKTSLQSESFTKSQEQPPSSLSDMTESFPEQRVNGISKDPVSAPSRVAGDFTNGSVSSREEAQPMPVPPSSQDRSGTTESIPLTPGSPDFGLQVGPITGIAGKKTSGHQTATIDQLQSFMPPLVSMTQSTSPDDSQSGVSVFQEQISTERSHPSKSTLQSSERADVSIQSIGGLAGYRTDGHVEASTEKLRSFMAPMAMEDSYGSVTDFTPSSFSEEKTKSIEGDSTIVSQNEKTEHSEV